MIPELVKKHPIYSQIWNDVYEKDLDALIAVCGRRGNCKSGTALRIGTDLDIDCLGKSRFSIDNVFFKANEFVAAFEKKHPAGTVIVWDEIGVENDAREWYTLKNRFIKHVMETNRYRKYVVLVTTPTLKSMDIATQRLLSGYIEMYGKANGGNEARGKFEWVETSPKTGKPYFKAPRYWRDGNFFYAKQFFWSKPDSDLWIAYEAKKQEYTTNLWKNIAGQLSYMSKMLGIKYEQQTKFKNIKELEAIVMSHPEKYFDTETKRFKAAILQEEFEIGYSLAIHLAQVLNWKLKKGEISVLCIS